MRARILLLALLTLLVAALPTGARATVEHRHVMLASQYVPSGTVYTDVTRRADGLKDHGLGYPVRRGDRITFTNLDQQPHTVTACDPCDPYPLQSELFTSPFLPMGRSWTLDTTDLPAGTYRYFCLHHLYIMHGSFTVVEA